MDEFKKLEKEIEEFLNNVKNREDGDFPKLELNFKTDFIIKIEGGNYELYHVTIFKRDKEVSQFDSYIKDLYEDIEYSVKLNNN